MKHVVKKDYGNAVQVVSFTEMMALTAVHE